MKDLLPTLDDLTNSIDSSPWANTSTMIDNHATLILPRYPTSDTPQLLSRKRKTDIPFATKSSKALASTKNQLKNPIRDYPKTVDYLASRVSKNFCVFILTAPS